MPVKFDFGCTTMVLLFSKVAVKSMFVASLRFLKAICEERFDPLMAIEKLILTIGLTEILLKGGDEILLMLIAVSLKEDATGSCSLLFLQEENRKVSAKKQLIILFMI